MNERKSPIKEQMTQFLNLSLFVLLRRGKLYEVLWYSKANTVGVWDSLGRRVTSLGLADGIGIIYNKCSRKYYVWLL
jgi:hypothetical protein